MRTTSPQLLKKIKKQQINLTISFEKTKIISRYAKYGILSHVLLSISILIFQIFNILSWWASLILIVSAFVNNYIFKKIGEYAAKQYEIDKRLGIL